MYQVIPSMGNMLLICTPALFTIQIVCYNLYHDAFYTCTKPETRSGVYINTEQECINNGGVWVNSPRNYDDLAQSFLSTVYLIIGQGWSDLMQLSTRARGPRLAPAQQQNLFQACAFFIMTLFGYFFIVYMLVGVVVDTFKNIRDESTGSILLSAEQRDWIDMQRIFMQHPPPKQTHKPSNWFRGICYDVQKSFTFEIVIIFLIVGHLIARAFVSRDLSAQSLSIISYVSYGFLVLFHLEFLIKALALHLEFFQEEWNIFDLLLLLLSDILLFFRAELGGFAHPTLPFALRIVRIGRVLSMISLTKAQKTLIDTLYYLVSVLVNVGLLIILMITLYAVIGMNLFPYVQFQNYINSTYNFSTFSGAFTILTTLYTSDKWDVPLIELSNPDLPGCKVNSTLLLPYEHRARSRSPSSR
jgi:hypothetical protein